jgi:uncharacterized RDD family membrane protein YckC
MNTITITTSQNIEFEYELGSLGDRIIGAIIDYIVVIAYLIIMMAVFVYRSSDVSPYVFILLLLPVVFYDLISELLLNGQSLGKKAMGIKVISISGDQPSLSQYLIRWVFRLVDFTLSSTMVAVVMVAATEKKQRLGDLIAGTVLVKTKPRTHLSDTFFEQNVAEAYAVTYPQVISLKDGDIQLIKEVLLSVRRTGNTMLALQAQQKVEQILHMRSIHQQPMDFLQTVLKDYNHLAAQL